jgi:hypothetical protein
VATEGEAVGTASSVVGSEVGAGESMIVASVGASVGSNDGLNDGCIVGVKGAKLTCTATVGTDTGAELPARGRTGTLP